jgi:hypothetical protein
MLQNCHVASYFIGDVEYFSLFFVGESRLSFSERIIFEVLATRGNPLVSLCTTGRIRLIGAVQGRSIELQPDDYILLLPEGATVELRTTKKFW